MSTLELDGYPAYVEYLEMHEEEFPLLFNTILINVTSFFRDPEAWRFMADEILPRVLQGKSEQEPIRAWVAGCASGEEAYTLAMLLSEAVETRRFREKVKIYATDLDEEALAQARLASYRAKDLENIPAEFLDKYFERHGDNLTFDRELRRSVIFGRHDLIQDAPISRVDLLLCRNTLMYFNAEAQERVLNRFHYVLKEDGYLFLGKAETLLTHGNLFMPIDLKHRIFTKLAKTSVRERGIPFVPQRQEPVRAEQNEFSRLREATFDAGLIAEIVVDSAGRLCFANEKARTMFGIADRDLRRPFQDLELSYRPVELRSGIEQAMRRRRSMVHKNVTFGPPMGEAISLDIHIVPLCKEAGEGTGTAVFFDDVTQYKRLQDELLNFNQELETAYEEVQSTNEELQTTNEELQSTIEELETTNEEFQSTNEELETANEELQSTNEELQTINEELHLRSEELNNANSFLESILGGLSDGVIVVDQDFHVLSWNPKSEDLWGLYSAEVRGKHLLNLDIGLPVEQLRAPIKACLATMTSEEVTVEAINRRGRAVSCKITITPLFGPAGGQLRGAILLVSTAPAAQDP